MSDFLETIVQKIETFQSLESWRPQEAKEALRGEVLMNFKNAAACKGAFAHFLNEWCDHLRTPGPIKKSILRDWSRGRNWRTEALKHSSSLLFQLGSQEMWKKYWAALENLSGAQSPLDICDEMLDWARGCLDPETLENFLQGANSKTRLERVVLGVLPYERGLLSLVLVKFPGSWMTPLHAHPECLAEVVLSGEIAELRFTQPNPDAFRYEKLEVLKAGDKILSHSDSGTPHMMYSKAQTVKTLAVFAGDRPMTYFPKQTIENPEAMEDAISSLEMKH